jgi:hypothetical protein
MSHPMVRSCRHRWSTPLLPRRHIPPATTDMTGHERTPQLKPRHQHSWPRSAPDQHRSMRALARRRCVPSWMPPGSSWRVPRSGQGCSLRPQHGRRLSALAESARALRTNLRGRAAQPKSMAVRAAGGVSRSGVRTVKTTRRMAWMPLGTSSEGAVVEGSSTPPIRSLSLTLRTFARLCSTKTLSTVHSPFSTFAATTWICRPSRQGPAG